MGIDEQPASLGFFIRSRDWNTALRRGTHSGEKDTDLHVYT